MFADSQFSKLIGSAFVATLALSVLPSFAQNGPQAPAAMTSPGSGAGFVIGSPNPGQSDHGKAQLIYRDPSKPLLIGEMAEIQRKKDVETFLRRAGFTTEKPPAPKTQSKAQVVERVQSSITLKALYAREGAAAWGEITNPSGILDKITPGARVSSRVSVQEVNGQQVVLLVKPDPSACKTAPSTKKSPKKTPPCTPGHEVTTTLHVGDTFRWYE